MHYFLPPYDFLMFSGVRKRVHWERMGSNIYLVNISNIYKSEVLGRFSMYYRFLMNALVSLETFLIFLSYGLNLSQFCLKLVWSSNYLIKEIISLIGAVLLFWFCYQCNNSYHSEKRRATKFIVLVIAHLWHYESNVV